MDRLERVAFLGLGIMGSRMAANLARAGFDLTVWNRTREKAEALAAELGASVADTPSDAARGAQAVITMVVDGPEVEAVLLGEHGAAEAMAEGALAIDMSTIAPSASREIAARLAERGVRFLDAPVSGSSPKAEDGTLTIMAGGDAADFERARPLFDAMGELIVQVGPQGHGSMVKLINNTVAAVNTAALAEGLALARSAGIDTDVLVRVMRASSGASLMLEIKSGPMLGGDFEPLFKLAHMLKDVRHTLSEAERLGAGMSVCRTAELLYEDADAQGLGDEDFAAVFRVVEGGSHPA
jgi:3-hydroxyisobutyrate dehydrogenase-like beta-hydroxyacid dehydrogenase